MNFRVAPMCRTSWPIVQEYLIPPIRPIEKLPTNYSNTSSNTNIGPPLKWFLPVLKSLPHETLPDRSLDTEVLVFKNSANDMLTTQEFSFVPRQTRLQDLTNRQNSVVSYDEELQREWYKKQEEVVVQAQSAYRWAIDHGIAKEQARVVLPEGLTESVLYVSGTIRSWIHYIQVRGAHGTQLEHVEIARTCAQAISSIFPSVYILTQ